MLHREAPDAKPAVKGGLLADDQGLGKTITTIALLLSHPPPQVSFNFIALTFSTSESCDRPMTLLLSLH